LQVCATPFAHIHGTHGAPAHSPLVRHACGSVASHADRHAVSKPNELIDRMQHRRPASQSAASSQRASVPPVQVGVPEARHVTCVGE
jgi:hypothetical protein